MNSEAMRKLRGPRSQEDFAQICGVSIDTIQRAERGGPLEFKTVANIVSRLGKAGKSVSSQALTIATETPQ
jgi:hypothetical protein